MKYLCVHCHAEELDRVSVHRLQIHPGMLELLEDMGILEVEGDTIHLEEFLRIKRILRLRRSLGVSLAAASIIADLLVRMEDMQQEIRRLRGGR